jgi:hypothetical protein
MIIDSVDDTHIFVKTSSGKLILEYIPQVGNCSVLYTSRSRDIYVDLVDDPVTVLPMPKAEAKLLWETVI